MVLAGDARLDNHAFKRTIAIKASILKGAEVEELAGSNDWVMVSAPTADR